MNYSFQLVELRRNPQGSIDKRIRATLRPMSKTRRDSSELEERLRDAKSINQRCRKILLEKEAELQGLLCRLGEEKIQAQHLEVVQLRRERKSCPFLHRYNNCRYTLLYLFVKKLLIVSE